MKITHTEIYRYSIPMVPFEIATGRLDYAQNVFIRIHTDKNIYGCGECSAFPMIVGETQDTCLVLARDFASIWKGRDPLEIEPRMSELDDYIAGNSTIKSAFDLALHDIAAKHAKQPLYAFLGGENRTIITDITVGIGPAPEMAKTALAFKNNGAHTLKVKVGKDPVEDIKRIAAIRHAVGDELPIRIDANQGWSYAQAVTALRGMESFHIEFCEQPLRSYDDHLIPALHQETSAALMADESCYNVHDVERLALIGGFAYINIKLAKSGGIAASRLIERKAAELGIPCMLGGMLESRLALTAMVHFALASENIRFYDLDTCLLGHLADPVIHGVDIDHYRLTLAEIPGIGADADPVFLAKCASWRV